MRANVVLSAVVLANLALAGGAQAAWSSDYQMGAFIASGGSDDEGWLSLECVDPQSEAANAGILSLSLIPQSDVTLGENGPTLLAFWVDASGSIPIPVRREGERTLVLDDEERLVGQSLLTMLSVGDTLTVRSTDRPAQTLVEISLKGAAKALQGFEACVASPR